MRKIFFMILLIFFIIFCISVFVVQESQRGIILRFGKVLRDSKNNPLIYDPGLHFKIPFIDSVKNLDARIQTMENQADRFVTMEKKDLIVDSYIKWRISNFSRYYLTTGGGDTSQAEVLIKRKFFDRLRSELGKLDVKGIVTDSRNRLMTGVKESLNNGSSNTNENIHRYNTLSSESTIEFNNTSNKIKFNKRLDQSLNTSINQNSMEALGIEIVDVRIKQINLPTEVSDAIYQRMRAEREAVARHHRSQGQEEAEKIRALADYKVTRTLAEAERQALITRGEADAEVAKLYSDSFSKNKDFYIFIRSLHAYENIFNKQNDILIINPENNFFRFMKLSKDNIINSNFQ